MDFPIKTLTQLRPILQGFRKAAGLTQAAMASHLGVTQQTYAQLEANPAAVSVERLFKVLRVLQVDLQLTPSAGESLESDIAAEYIAPSADRTIARRAAKTASSAVTGSVKRKNQTQSKPKAPAQTQGKLQGLARSRSPSTTASKTPRATTKPRSATKKREDW